MNNKKYDDDLDFLNGKTPAITGTGTGTGGGATTATIPSTAIASSFVKKLFEMVENESDEIIVWVANGTAFEVKDPKRLEVEILPNFFRHGRFQSLVRQLNFYAFKVLVNLNLLPLLFLNNSLFSSRPSCFVFLLRKLAKKEVLGFILMITSKRIDQIYWNN